MATIQAIETLQPASYIMENLVTLTEGKEGETDYAVIAKYAGSRLPNYNAITLIGTDPTQDEFHTVEKQTASNWNPC